MKKYYLGKRKEDGKKVYLISPSWDCGWYWGFGYVETFTKNDIYDHQHFDTLFLKENIFDSFINYFDEINIKRDDVWLLLSYMKEFYIMQQYAELLKHGGYISTRAISILDEKNKQQNEQEYKRINETLLPELFEKIKKIFEMEK